MRTLSATTSSKIADDVTTPGYLVYIDFTTPKRFSSRGTIVFNGDTFQPWDVKISGLGLDGASAGQTGQLQLDDRTNVISATCLIDRIADRVIKVWKFYGDANPATDDPVLIFSGVGDECNIDPDRDTVTITLQQSSGRSLYCPRHSITKEQGFNFLPAPGTFIFVGSELYTLTDG